MNSGIIRGSGSSVKIGVFWDLEHTELDIFLAYQDMMKIIVDTVKHYQSYQYMKLIVYKNIATEEDEKHCSLLEKADFEVSSLSPSCSLSVDLLSYCVEEVKQGQREEEEKKQEDNVVFVVTGNADYSYVVNTIRLQHNDIIDKVYVIGDKPEYYDVKDFMALSRRIPPPLLHHHEVVAQEEEEEEEETNSYTATNIVYSSESYSNINTPSRGTSRTPSRTPSIVNNRPYHPQNSVANRPRQNVNVPKYNHDYLNRDPKLFPGDSIYIYGIPRYIKMNHILDAFWDQGYDLYGFVDIDKQKKSSKNSSNNNVNNNNPRFGFIRFKDQDTRKRFFKDINEEAQKHGYTNNIFYLNNGTFIKVRKYKQN